MASKPPPKKTKRAGVSVDPIVGFMRRVLGIEDPNAAVNTPETAAQLPTIFARPEARALDPSFQPNMLTQEIGQVLSSPFAQDTLKRLFNVRATAGSYLGKDQEPGVMAFVDTKYPSRVNFPVFGLKRLQGAKDIGETLIHELTHSEQYAKTGKPEFLRFQKKVEDKYLNMLNQIAEWQQRYPGDDYTPVTPQRQSAPEMMGYAMQTALSALRMGADPAEFEGEFPGTVDAYEFLTTMLGPSKKRKPSRR